MSQSITQIDYEALQRVAKSFHQESEEIAQTCQATRQKMETLQNGWSGIAANNFFAEMERDLIPSMERLSRALLTSEKVANQIAKIFHDADTETVSYYKILDEGEIGITGDKGTASSSMPLLGALGGLLKGLSIPSRYILESITPNLARGNTTVAMLKDMLLGRSGKGMWMLRFDGAHGGTPYPHINLNPKYMKPGPLMKWLFPNATKLKDPHLQIPPSVLKGAGTTAKWLGRVQKAAPWVAAGIDLFRLGSAFHSDGNRIGANTARTAGSVAGGWGGAFVGAKVGAAGGAAIGSFICPGVGTAVGGFIGGLGGGIVGGIGGSSLGEEIVSWFQ